MDNFISSNSCTVQFVYVIFFSTIFTNIIEGDTNLMSWDHFGSNALLKLIIRWCFLLKSVTVR